MRYCVYGNPTLDIIYENNKPPYTSHGGGSYYSTLPLLVHGVKPEVYAVYSRVLVDHPVSSYIVKQQYSSRANIFVLEYRGLHRDLKILEVSENILDWNTHIGICNAIVNPVIGEISINLVKKIRLSTEILSIDIQGFIRDHVNTEIRLIYKPDVLFLFELADIIHTDQDEYNALMEISNFAIREKIHKTLRGSLVITSPPNKAVLITRHKTRYLEFEDNYIAFQRTGAGDYYLGAYTYYYYKSMDEEEAAYKAHDETSRWLRHRDKGLIAPPSLSHLIPMASLKTISDIISIG
ncbi:MAG: hypothetical protein QXE81_03365 [Desulfurococcaceae archaeon]